MSNIYAIELYRFLLPPGVAAGNSWRGESAGFSMNIMHLGWGLAILWRFQG
jgi:hypothetical protein